MNFTEYLESIVAEKEARATQIRESIKTAQTADEVRSLGEELADVNAKLAEARAQLANVNAKPEKLDVIATFGEAREEGEDKAVEARAAKFAQSGKMVFDTEEQRAVLMSSGDIINPTKVGGINETLNSVPSIINQVNVEDCKGMGAYKVSYVDGELAANDDTVEGEAIKASDMAFKYVEIKPVTIDVYTEISDKVKRQSPLQYQAKVEAAALKALRRKVAEYVTKGNAEGFKGIVNSELAKKLPALPLDEKFLRKVSLTYGGNNDIAQGATLYLNKASLITLGDVRGDDLKAVYDITPNAANPNTGIIKDGGLSVPYTLNDNLAEGATIYGQPLNYTVGLFSDYEIKTSEDAAFQRDMIAIKGHVELGGAVCFKEGFIVTSAA
jgi:HK97 family phage major capsid protein